MTDEAAPAIRVFPVGLEALALERVTERVGGLGTDASGKRRIGDHLVAAGVVAFVERARDDLGEPGRPERRTRRVRHAVGAVGRLALAVGHGLRASGSSGCSSPWRPGSAGRHPGSSPSRSGPRAGGRRPSLSTIKTDVGFLWLVFRERRRSVHGGGDAEPAEVDPVPRPFRHLPGHHGPIAVDENLGIREARAGEDVGGACLDIVAANACRAGGCGSQAEQRRDSRLTRSFASQ